MTAPLRSDKRPAFDYSSPTRQCDVVMKGGITSGIVYPLAVCELAQSFRFRNIGGTSAGAIAAAVTAAAEYGRATPGAGFEHLERLPSWLGGGTNLFSLFQPSPDAKPVFDTFAAALGNTGGSMARIARVIEAAVHAFPGAALIGLLPGVLLATVLRHTDGFDFWLVLVCSVALAILGMAISLATALATRALRVLARENYGLCSGNAVAASAPPALTPWLADLIDTAAGIKGRPKPLTFGDLWGQSDPNAEKRINLEMMTTNLTFGCPYRLPLQDRRFFFDPKEFRELFPERVVSWMEESVRDRTQPGDRILAFPDPADLPVIVAARMSLSFPLLFRAVPLWAVDYTREGEPEAERCWFSDGGICSNFPVHFFDSPLPKWPTFGINLRPFHPDFPRSETDESANVWMPNTNIGGTREWWLRFDVPEPGARISNATKLGGFMGAIVNAMQNWRDNAQLRVPGYRDRVAHVKLDERSEGGMNLAMPADVIERLSERGRCAGELLHRRYSGAPLTDTDISWDNHRWVRYRSTLAVLSSYLKKVTDAYASTVDGDRTFAQLAMRGADDPPKSYRWKSQDIRSAAGDAMSALSALCSELDRKGVDFTLDAPQPAPDLRMTPRV